MTCNLSRYELYILKRIAFDKSRWCNKHISAEDLAGSTPIDKRHLYKDAIDSLVRKGYLRQYKSQGRVDLCVVKQYKYRMIGFFQAHQDEYLFLQGLDFNRMR